MLCSCKACRVGHGFVCLILSRHGNPGLLSDPLADGGLGKRKCSALSAAVASPSFKRGTSRRR